MGKLLFLNVGKPETSVWNGKAEQSAIGKKSVSEAFLTKEGFQGDGVAATDFHGGPDRAVCFYPVEHYAQWESEFGKTLKSPSFGENISTPGMKESEVFIGDVYKLGSAIVQISQPRIPCSKISKNNGIGQLLKRVVATGYTGYFFRVLEEGMVYADAEISILERSRDSFSILKCNKLFYEGRSENEAVQELLKVKELAKDWKEQLNKLLKQKN